MKTPLQNLKSSPAPETKDATRQVDHGAVADALAGFYEACYQAPAGRAVIDEVLAEARALRRGKQHEHSDS